MNDQDLARQLGSIAEKLDNLIEFRREHEMRIKSLELIAAQAQGGWKIIVMLAGISGAIGAFVSWALQHIKP